MIGERPYQSIIKPQKSFLSKLLLFLAASILLMHLLVPHRHTTGNEPGYEWVAAQSNVVSFLNNLFNLNLGENHLEDFKPNHTHLFFFMATLSVMMVSICLTLVQPAKRRLTDWLARIKVSPGDKLFTSSRPFRAPPMV